MRFAARPAICTAARDLAGAKVSILYEPDPKGQELVSTAVVGAQVDQIHLPFTGRPSGAATAFSSGQPHFVADLPDNKGVAQPVRDELNVLSALWQPVIRNGVPIGVLTLAWEERVADPGERVRSLIALLAAEAAVAIERADLLARLETVARTDDLTGLANRRAWDEHLPRELSRAGRDGQPLCVAMLDLDRFKEYNDERGHQAGDRLLKQVSGAWREMLRPSDMLARYGGEEFGLVLPNCPIEKGVEVVERLREYMVARPDLLRRHRGVGRRGGAGRAGPPRRRGALRGQGGRPRPGDRRELEHFSTRGGTRTHMARRPRPFEGRASDQFRHPGGSGRMLSGGRLAAGPRRSACPAGSAGRPGPRPRRSRPAGSRASRSRATAPGREMISSVTRPRMPSSSAGS